MALKFCAYHADGLKQLGARQKRCRFCAYQKLQEGAWMQRGCSDVVAVLASIR